MCLQALLSLPCLNGISTSKTEWIDNAVWHPWDSSLAFCDYCAYAEVTIAIVWVFREWVSNNRIYFGANQHNKYPSCGLSRTLCINDDLPIVVEDNWKYRLPHGEVFLRLLEARKILGGWQLSFLRIFVPQNVNRCTLREKKNALKEASHCKSQNKIHLDSKKRLMQQKNGKKENLYLIISQSFKEQIV